MNLTFGFEMAQAKLRGVVGAFDRACEEWVKDGVLIVEGRTKDILTEGRAEWPDLADSTVKGTGRGKRDNILYVTGVNLRDTVTCAVEKKGSSSKGYVGWSGIDNPIGRTHEFGTKRAGAKRNITIPARPHIRPAVTESETRLKEAFLQRVREAL